MRSAMIAAAFVPVLVGLVHCGGTAGSGPDSMPVADAGELPVEMSDAMVTMNTMNTVDSGPTVFTTAAHSPLPQMPKHTNKILPTPHLLTITYASYTYQHYSGDANFSAGSAGLVQFVHASGTTTTLASSAVLPYSGQPITFTATVTAALSGNGTPTGQVTFKDGSSVIWQAPVDSSGAASCRMPAMSSGSHTITAVYASDTNFAASSGSMVQKVQSLHIKVSSAPNPSVKGRPVLFNLARIGLNLGFLKY